MRNYYHQSPSTPVEHESHQHVASQLTEEESGPTQQIPRHSRLLSVSASICLKDNFPWITIALAIVIIMIQKWLESGEKQVFTAEEGYSLPISSAEQFVFLSVWLGILPTTLRLYTSPLLIQNVLASEITPTVRKRDLRPELNFDIADNLTIVDYDLLPVLKNWQHTPDSLLVSYKCKSSTTTSTWLHPKFCWNSAVTIHANVIDEYGSITTNKTLLFLPEESWSFDSGLPVLDRLTDNRFSLTWLDPQYMVHLSAFSVQVDSNSNTILIEIPDLIVSNTPAGTILTTYRQPMEEFSALIPPTELTRKASAVGIREDDIAVSWLSSETTEQHHVLTIRFLSLSGEFYGNESLFFSYDAGHIFSEWSYPVITSLEHYLAIPYFECNQYKYEKIQKRIQNGEYFYEVPLGENCSLSLSTFSVKYNNSTSSLIATPYSFEFFENTCIYSSIVEPSYFKKPKSYVDDPPTNWLQLFEYGEFDKQNKTGILFDEEKCTAIEIPPVATEGARDTVIISEYMNRLCLTVNADANEFTGALIYHQTPDGSIHFTPTVYGIFNEKNIFGSQTNFLKPFINLQATALTNHTLVFTWRNKINSNDLYFHNLPLNLTILEPQSLHYEVTPNQALPLLNLQVIAIYNPTSVKVSVLLIDNKFGSLSSEAPILNSNAGLDITIEYYDHNSGTWSVAGSLANVNNVLGYLKFLPSGNIENSTELWITAEDNVGQSDLLKLSLSAPMVEIVNNKPVLQRNKEILLLNGKSIILSAENLNIVDAEVKDPYELYYAIASLRELLLSLLMGNESAILKAGNNFTQADINNELVSLQATQDATAPALTFQYYEGNYINQTRSPEQEIVIKPHYVGVPVLEPQAIPLIIKQSNTINNNFPVVLTSNHLSASAIGASAKELKFIITNIKHLKFAVNQKIITMMPVEFTLEDIEQSRVLLYHDGSNNEPSFDVQVIAYGLTNAEIANAVNINFEDEDDVYQQNLITIVLGLLGGCSLLSSLIATAVVLGRKFCGNDSTTNPNPDTSNPGIISEHQGGEGVSAQIPGVSDTQSDSEFSTALTGADDHTQQEVMKRFVEQITALYPNVNDLINFLDDMIKSLQESNARHQNTGAESTQHSTTSHQSRLTVGGDMVAGNQKQQLGVKMSVEQMMVLFPNVDDRIRVLREVIVALRPPSDVKHQNPGTELSSSSFWQTLPPGTDVKVPDGGKLIAGDASSYLGLELTSQTSLTEKHGFIKDDQKRRDSGNKPNDELLSDDNAF